MRIAFEVAKEYGLHELRESSREIFDRYYHRLLAKTESRERSDHVLVATAKALFETNVDRIEITRLHSSLGLRVTEELPRDLFLSGIFERVPGENAGSGAVRFAFEGLRNYVIAFKALRWQEQTIDAFGDQIRHLDSGSVREETLIAYYKLAPDEHKRVLDRECYGRALRFLAAYKDIIQTHFAAFSFAFPPGDLEKAGLVLEGCLPTNRYGLRLLSPGEPPVLILPTSTGSWRSGSLAKVGAGGLANRLGSNWLHGVNAYHELLQVNFAHLIPKIIRGGALNEEATPDLSRELLAAAVLSKPELLNEPECGPGKESLPLNVGRLRHWLLFQQHWRRLERQLIKSKISSGEISVRREGAYISYTEPPLKEEERRELRQRCETLIARGAEIDKQQFAIKDLANRLKQAVSWLEGDAVVEGPLFVEAESLWRRPSGHRAEGAEFLEYYRHFMQTFLTNYERLIGTNFPTLRHEFTLYRELPVLVRIAIDDAPDVTMLGDRRIVAEFLAPFDFTLNESSIETVEYSRLVGSDSWDEEKVRIDGRLFRRVLARDSYASEILGSSLRHYPDLGLRPWLTVLRDYTYSWIESELKKVGRALGELYGVDNLDFRV